jgi:hypothetical protein
VLYLVQLALLVSFGVVIDAFAAVAIWTAAGVFPISLCLLRLCNVSHLLVRIFLPFEVADW